MKDSLGSGRRSPPKPHGGGVGVLLVKDERGSRSLGRDIGLPRGIGRRFCSISKGSNSNLDCPMVDNGGFRRDDILGVGRRYSISLEGVNGGSLVAEDDIPSPKCNRCSPVCSCEENMEDGCSHLVLFQVYVADNKDNGVASTLSFAPMQEENLGVHDDCRGIEGATKFLPLISYDDKIIECYDIGDCCHTRKEC